MPTKALLGRVVKVVQGNDELLRQIPEMTFAGAPDVVASAVRVSVTFCDAVMGK